MRKVVSYFVYALDGVVDHPEEWVFDRFDDEMTGHLAALIARQDAVLLGRRTYGFWASYWPTSTHEPFASFINNTPKHVASTTLDEVTGRTPPSSMALTTAALGGTAPRGTRPTRPSGSISPATHEPDLTHRDRRGTAQPFVMQRSVRPQAQPPLPARPYASSVSHRRPPAPSPRRASGQ